MDLRGALGHAIGCCARAARLLITGQKWPDVQDLPDIRWHEEEAVMMSKSAEPAHGNMEELHAALDAIPADDPRNYLRQSLQLLVPLLEQMQHHLDLFEARLAALESRRV
jgi:hypothetical protein